MYATVNDPEILTMIFESLHDDRQMLCRSMLVSRAWGDEVAAVIWRKPPPYALT